MRLYALVEAGDPETIDLFLTEEEALSARSRVAYGMSRSGGGCFALSRSSSRARACHELAGLTRSVEKKEGPPERAFHCCQ
jgi:hypothetical protein